MNFFRALLLTLGRLIHRISPRISHRLQPLYLFFRRFEEGRHPSTALGASEGLHLQKNRLAKHPKVALLSSAGLYLSGQKPFDYKNFYGDASYRVFPSDFPLSELLLTESDFDRSGFEADPASLFPLPDLKAVLPEFGGRPAAHHFSLLGFCLKERELLEANLPEMLRILREDETDVVLLLPVCVVCHEVLPKVAQEFESAGITTVTFAFIPKALEKVRAPRSILIGGDCGLPFGSCAQTRKEALRMALKAATEMKTAGEVWKFPTTGQIASPPASLGAARDKEAGGLPLAWKETNG